MHECADVTIIVFKCLRDESVVIMHTSFINHVQLYRAPVYFISLGHDHFIVLVPRHQEGGELGKTFFKSAKDMKKYSFLQGSPCTWWHDLV